MFYRKLQACLVCVCISLPLGLCHAQGIIKRGGQKIIPSLPESSAKVSILQKKLLIRLERVSRPQQKVLSLISKEQLNFKPVASGGKQYFVSPAGIKLSSQSDVSAFIYAVKNNYYSVVVKSFSVHGFCPVKDVCLKSLWQAQEYVQAAKQGYQVEIKQGCITGISPKEGVWLKTMSSADMYAQASKEGLNPQVKDGKIVSYVPDLEVQFHSVIAARDYCRARRLGYKVRIQENKITGFSPAPDMWFYHLSDAKAYVLALKENPLQQAENGILTVRSSKPLYFRFEPKHNAYFLFDPQYNSPSRPFIIDWPRL